MEQGLFTFLTKWSLELPKPLVLFIDEIDALIGDSLISVLRQLRDGYNQRPKAVDRLSLPSGWLIVFSREPVKDWDQVGRREHLTEAGKQINLIWL